MNLDVRHRYQPYLATGTSSPATSLVQQPERSSDSTG